MVLRNVVSTQPGAHLGQAAHASNHNLQNRAGDYRVAVGCYTCLLSSKVVILL